MLAKMRDFAACVSNSRKIPSTFFSNQSSKGDKSTIIVCAGCSFLHQMFPKTAVENSTLAMCTCWKFPFS